MSEVLRLHHLEPASRVNGPGLRAVIWLQGCTLGCPQCFNPETHSRQGGFPIRTGDLLSTVKSLESIEGITLSGGEPLQQIEPVTRWLEQLRRETNLTVLIFTGFTWEEAARIPGFSHLIRFVDVFIAGRYKAEKRMARSLIGSANKTVHFLTARYSLSDLEAVPEAEVIISDDGSISLSGIDPLHWEQPG